MSETGRSTRRRRRRLIGAYLVLCFFAQVWPLAGLANHVTPRIAGLPFLFVWYVVGVFAVFVGLAALYATESGK